MQQTKNASPTPSSRTPQAKAQKLKKAGSRRTKHGSPESRRSMRQVADERDDFDMRPPDSGVFSPSIPQQTVQGHAQGVRVHTARLPHLGRGSPLTRPTDGAPQTGPQRRSPSTTARDTAAAGNLPMSRDGYADVAQSPASHRSGPGSSTFLAWSPRTHSPSSPSGSAAFLRQPAFSSPLLPQDPLYDVTSKRARSIGPLWATLCVLAVVVLAAVVAVAIMKASWYSVAPLSSPCSTHACLAYSTRILASLNESVNPCKSFTRFVCDGWRKAHRSDVWDLQFLHVLDRLTASLKDITVPPTGQNEEQRAAAVYRSCVSLLEGSRDELPAVLKALDDAGIVWPQPSTGADVLYTLLYCSMKLGWDVLLNFYVVANGNGSAVELVAAPGRLFSFPYEKYLRLEAAEDRAAYFEFLAHRLRGNGTVTLTYNQTQGLEEHALATLPYHITSTVRAGSVEGFPDTTDIGLTEAKWMAVLRKLDANLTKVSSLMTTNIRYVNVLLKLWRSYDSDLFHELVSWFTVQVAALFANRELIYNYYDDKYNMGHIYYGIFCAARAMFFSRQALFARYNADVLQGKAGSIARELTLSVRNAFRRRLSNWTYFDENITVVANWSSLATVFSNMEESSEENETRIRGQLPDMTDSFLKNWQHSVLVRNEPEVEDMLQSMLHLNYYVISYEKRDFQLMPYALSFPLFDAMLPSSVNYGGFGLEITQAMSDLLLGFYETSVIPQNMSLAECLIASQFGGVFDPQFYESQTFGLNALVDAYELTGRTSDNALQGLEKYRGLPMLFIAMCYFQCVGSIDEGDGEAVCNLPLQQLPQFAEAFHCAPGEPLNPAKRCELL
ncbi:endothelin-converting enzyme 1 [Rhipicephalus sanguineus]|uniref:endothelin-converting enzyme 1 n=1 Tax=Rhipicephalus sanguineus TaxID=34632 RepID=UPI0018945EB7|nr:endothelin-converting enzyme 1 [Rhipicephalus sanguineus]